MKTIITIQHTQSVHHMFENNEGKRFIKRVSDMSYID